MKGKLYKPVKKYSISEKNLKPRTRPWKDPPQVPIVYFWKSSIPEKYFKDKSRILRHISETKRIQNTQEFLRKSQKYIEIIADSHRHTPSMRASMMNSRNDSFDQLEQVDARKPKILAQLGSELTVNHGQMTERVGKIDKFRVAERVSLGSVKGLAKNEALWGNRPRILARRSSMHKDSDKAQEQEQEIPRHWNIKFNSKGGIALPGKEMGQLSTRVVYTVNSSKHRRGSLS